MTTPNKQHGRTGILASLDQRAPARRVPAGTWHTALVLLAAIALLACVSWLLRRDSAPAVPHADARHVVLLEGPAEPEVEAVATIITEPVLPGPAHAVAPPRPQASTSGVRTPPLVKRVEARRGPAPEDSDVALLAALVAHSSAEKDVVTHQRGSSTASLLRHCRRLGGIEGDLCEARICSGVASGEAPCRAR